MSRSLEIRTHFRKAITKLPLGVPQFPRLGEEDHLRLARPGRAPDRYRRQRVHRLPPGLRPLHPGYADARVDEAARRGQEVGGVFALGTEREYEVAKRISSMVPAAELVRFSNSGTEAVMAALRLARAYTGRDSYVVIEGGYHGVFDAALWYTPVEDWRPVEGEPHLVPYSAGVPGMLRALIHASPMNDADRLESIFKAYGHEIAAFLIEPIMGNCCSISATREFVHAARQLCDKYGIVMIIDEVKTGFRVARAVARTVRRQGDLCTFARPTANGDPISALAGREEIMRKNWDRVATWRHLHRDIP